LLNQSQEICNNYQAGRPHVRVQQFGFMYNCITSDGRIEKTAYMI